MKKIIILWLFTFIHHGYAKELRIGFTNHESQLVAATILKKVYEKAGIPVTIASYPGARLTSLIRTKKLDGEVARIEEYFDKNLDLKKINVPIYYFDAWVYTNGESSLQLRSLEDLRKYRVGIIRGVLYSEILTKNFKNKFYAESSKQLFDLLASKRIDAVIDTDLMRMVYVNRFKEKNIKPEFFIKRYSFYHGLRKDLASEYQKIDRVMAELGRANGLQELISKAEKEVMSLPVDHPFVIQ